MPYNDLKDYYKFVKSIVSRSEVSNHEQVIRIRPDKRYGNSGIIYATKEHPLLFIDGASLSFIENIEIVNREIKRIEYSYQYTRSNFFFRYDKDPSVIRLDHALCHLHAHQEEPRFPSAEMSLEAVFLFILAVYY